MLQIIRLSVAIVVAEPPQFVETSPELVIAAEGQMIGLKCKAFGAPKPSVTWMRSRLWSDIASSDRVTVLEYGTLQIEVSV